LRPSAVDDPFVGLIHDLDRYDERGEIDEAGRRCSRSYVAHYPARGKHFNREDIRRASDAKRVADIRHRTSVLGYDDRGRLWTSSQSVVSPRDGRPATVIRAVSAYRAEGDNLGESWHWIDPRPPVSASELTDQLRRYGKLREAGALSETEFAEKKADLLARV
jgi:hypothetical protein